MSGEENGMILPQLLEQGQRFANLLRIEASGRLIENQDRRIMDHGVGQTNALAIALRQRAD